MLATLSEESFRYVLDNLGSNGYDHWRSLIGAQPLIIPDPFNKEQQVEVVAMWDGARAQTIRVCVFAMRDMTPRDLLAQFRRARPKDSEDFLVFRDGRTDPEFAPSKK